jgi:hypothetical protein
MAERAGLGGGRRQVVVPAQSGRAVSVTRSVACMAFIDYIRGKAGR